MFGKLSNMSGKFSKRCKKIKEIILRIEYMERKINQIYEALLELRIKDMNKNCKMPDIICGGGESGKNVISDYWTEHTVLDAWELSNKESVDYCYKRFSLYPKFREMTHMDDDFEGKIILDYGCGPGNDLVWFAKENKLKKIIGMDVSFSALKHAQYRLGLLGINPKTVELYLLNEAEHTIPINNGSVDYISSQGVLMHTSNPKAILKEFRRVIIDDKKTDECKVCIMVYNRDSIWYHLYAAYYLRYIDASMFNGKNIKEMSLDEIFRRSTDGINCPKADCYTEDEFCEMCKEAGWGKVEYLGGYPNNLEPELAKKWIKKALSDNRLEEEHKKFLREVKINNEGYPIWNGKLCCVGGVYRLYLPKSI